MLLFVILFVVIAVALWTNVSVQMRAAEPDGEINGGDNGSGGDGNGTAALDHRRSNASDGSSDASLRRAPLAPPQPPPQLPPLSRPTTAPSFGANESVHARTMATDVSSEDDARGDDYSEARDDIGGYVNGIEYDRGEDDESERSASQKRRLVEAKRDRVREERNRKLKEKLERRIREDNERRAREEKERRDREDNERRAREEKERRTREEQERRAREEKERRAKMHTEMVEAEGERAESPRGHYLNSPFVNRAYLRTNTLYRDDRNGKRSLDIDIGAIVRASNGVDSIVRNIAAFRERRASDASGGNEIRPRDRQITALNRFWAGYLKYECTPVDPANSRGDQRGEVAAAPSMDDPAKARLAFLLDTNDDDRLLQLAVVLVVLLKGGCSKELADVYGALDPRLVGARLAAATALARRVDRRSEDELRAELKRRGAALDVEAPNAPEPARLGVTAPIDYYSLFEFEDGGAWTPVAPALAHTASRVVRLYSANGAPYDFGLPVRDVSTADAIDHERDGPYVSHTLVNHMGAHAVLVDGSRFSRVRNVNPSRPVVVTLRNVSANDQSSASTWHADGANRSRITYALHDGGRVILDVSVRVIGGPADTNVRSDDRSVWLVMQPGTELAVIVRQRLTDPARSAIESSWLSLDENRVGEGALTVENRLRVSLSASACRLEPL